MAAPTRVTAPSAVTETLKPNWSPPKPSLAASCCVGIHPPLAVTENTSTDPVRTPATNLKTPPTVANAPSSVRQCLDKQLGSIAGKNSCEGPWTTSLSLRVALVSQALKIPDRATISLGIANPLTGIDALLHGSSNLHGWGAPAATDPNLLYVRGFDQTAQRYIYDVNPRFGANRQARASKSTSLNSSH